MARHYYDALYLPRAYERLGQLHEERGEVEEAIRFYTLFVDLWADADPELQPRVEVARGALERLQALTGDSVGSDPDIDPAPVHPAAETPE